LEANWRVRAAIVHGSTVLGRLTPLSDLELIVIAEPGQQDAIWEDRILIATRILGTPPAVTEVLDIGAINPSSSRPPSSRAGGTQ
jgi:predicted nucleotidyltransferase